LIDSPAASIKNLAKVYKANMDCLVYAIR
jgi:hypothetical protein